MIKYLRKYKPGHAKVAGGTKSKLKGKVCMRSAIYITSIHHELQNSLSRFFENQLKSIHGHLNIQ